MRRENSIPCNNGPERRQDQAFESCFIKRRGRVKGLLESLAWPFYVQWSQSNVLMKELYPLGFRRFSVILNFILNVQKIVHGALNVVPYTIYAQFGGFKHKDTVYLLQLQKYISNYACCYTRRKPTNHLRKYCDWDTWQNWKKFLYNPSNIYTLLMLKKGEKKHKVHVHWKTTTNQIQH